MTETFIDFNAYIDSLKRQSKLDKFLARSKSSIKNWVENKTIHKENLRYLFDSVSTSEELKKFLKHDWLLKYMLKNNILAFSEIVDRCAEFRMFYSLFDQENFIRISLKKQLLTKTDIEYLLQKADECEQLFNIINNRFLFLYALKNEVLNFIEFISDLRNLSHLVLDSHKRFLFLFDNSALTQKDIYELLLSTIYLYDALNILNTKSLMTYVLRNNLLKDEALENFESLLQTKTWFDLEYQPTVFEAIELFHKNDFEILDLVQVIKLTKTFSAFTNFEQSQVAELCLAHNEQKNKLFFIANQNLQEAFCSFDELMKYLNKKEKKTSINI